jgi:hypothetical protein
MVRVASRAAQGRRVVRWVGCASLLSTWRPLDSTRRGSGSFAAPVMATAVRRSALERPASYSRRDAVVQQFLSLTNDGAVQKTQTISGSALKSEQFPNRDQHHGRNQLCRRQGRERCGNPDHVTFRGRASRDIIGHGLASPRSV